MASPLVRVVLCSNLIAITHTGIRYQYVAGGIDQFSDALWLIVREFDSGGLGLGSNLASELCKVQLGSVLSSFSIRSCYQILSVDFIDGHGDDGTYGCLLKLLLSSLPAAAPSARAVSRTLQCVIVLLIRV
ncbi:hypothetical protein B0J11DRAFT_523208 [Dendryphion nanum]|uniref:Uncharacterized protein n=1 Tax=Dendryphion nanum TaxID=256645 RepID=A0A9P9E1F0_9PLEO|nr:hypothetical protein B0J11DRAFT_523208 [Dendryphion nanum]